MDYQFYPTPRALANKLWAKFSNRHFRRVLEPQAGNGDLADAAPVSGTKIDCYEIDVSKHATLNAKGYKVVGMDFLQMRDASQYDAVIMNPPFAHGAQHVLKAWEILWDGEIAAIVNAETIRNPCDRMRERLVNLVQQYGHAEIVEGAFMDVDAQRKTPVDVALIYLHKKADITEDILGNLLDDLKEDVDTDGSSLKDEFTELNQLAIPRSEIENRVVVFNAAVRSTKDSIKAKARANYYTNLLGETMAVRNGDQEGSKRNVTIDFVQTEFSRAYEDLKDRAWAGILRSTDVTSRLSTQAQRKLEKEFESIKRLEFTTHNVLCFLHGIVMSQGELQIDMACEIFDEITRYWTDNTSFYRGWKSNDKHRTAGRRIKKTRFVLPRFNASFSRGLEWDGERRLQDFDRVFAMLDGKLQPEISLVEVFRKKSHELRAGERVSASYFDVRWYPGVGTIHFFPRNQEVMDRLNKMVGRHRQWLPKEEGEANADFWKQYDQADRLTKELEQELSGRRGNYGSSVGRSLYHDLNSRMDDDRLRAEAIIDRAMCAVHEKHGIDIERRIERHAEPTQLLLAA